MPELTDEEYTARALACERRLYRVARSMLPDDADCADAIQEAVVKGWLHRERLREAESFDAWLVRILINECRSALRARKRRRDLPLDEAIDVKYAQSAPDMDLWRAFERLPEGQRLPMTLHHVEGFGVDEVARMMGLTVSAVKSRLFQARRALKRALDDEEA